MNSLPWWKRTFRDHATLVVLLVLSSVLSVATITRQYPLGAAGGRQLASAIARQAPSGSRVLLVVRDIAEDAEFASAAAHDLESRGYVVVATVKGEPRDARRALEQASSAGDKDRRHRRH